MMGKLDSKVAIVTGGASGFGEATCILFAEEDSAVVVADVDTKKGHVVVDHIKEKGGSAEFVEVDVSKPDHAERLVAETVKIYGKIDILFNNAGILGPRDTYTADFLIKEAERLVSVNFNGVFYCTKQVIPEMIKSGGGSIIATGSDSAFVGNRSLAGYSATKGAVPAFSRVVAMEYVDRGIRVNTISPGAGNRTAGI
jgi:NAD(P)-dependent dehydrogenase (short-subunit alcohol dehydrogenase family)